MLIIYDSFTVVYRTSFCTGIFIAATHSFFDLDVDGLPERDSIEYSPEFVLNWSQPSGDNSIS